MWGSLRTVAPPEWLWVGLDLDDGHGVDIVLEDAYRFPLSAESVDIVVSIDTFEHADMFWLTFLEMVRILRVGGFAYVSAPSDGGWHWGPLDG